MLMTSRAVRFGERSGKRLLLGQIVWEPNKTTADVPDSAYRVVDWIHGRSRFPSLRASSARYFNAYRLAIHGLGPLPEVSRAVRISFGRKPVSVLVHQSFPV